VYLTNNGVPNVVVASPVYSCDADCTARTGIQQRLSAGIQVYGGAAGGLRPIRPSCGMPGTQRARERPDARTGDDYASKARPLAGLSSRDVTLPGICRGFDSPHLQTQGLGQPGRARSQAGTQGRCSIRRFHKGASLPFNQTSFGAARIRQPTRLAQEFQRVQRLPADHPGATTVPNHAGRGAVSFSR